MAESVYHRYLSCVIVAIIWLSMAIISLIIYFLFPDEIYYWDKVYDNCSRMSAKYTYSVRLLYNKMAKGFDPTKTTITVHVLNADEQTLSTVKITPKMMASSVRKLNDKGNSKICRFLLFRNEDLTKNMAFVVVYHNGEGVIGVDCLEFQEVRSPMANVGFVHKDIVNMPKEKAKSIQHYPAAHQDAKELEPELRPTQTLTALEFVVFFFLVINLVLILTIYWIPSVKDCGLFCKDYSGGEMSSLFAAMTASVTAAVVFIVVCLIYRYLIKRPAAKGNKSCSVIRYGYLLLWLTVGLICGVVATYMAYNNNYFPENNKDNKFNHEINWMFAVGGGLFIFFFVFVSILSVIAYVIGFLSEPDSEMVDVNMDKEALKAKEEPDNYTSYMNRDIKIKSISQYKGPAKSTSGIAVSGPPATSKAVPSKMSVKEPSKMSKKPSKEPSKKDEEKEDDGESYYKQLMGAQGKVKSVSQYGGAKK